MEMEKHKDNVKGWGKIVVADVTTKMLSYSFVVAEAEVRSITLTFLQTKIEQRDIMIYVVRRE